MNNFRSKMINKLLFITKKKETNKKALRENNAKVTLHIRNDQILNNMIRVKTRDYNSTFDIIKVSLLSFLTIAIGRMIVLKLLETINCNMNNYT